MVACRDRDGSARRRAGPVPDLQSWLCGPSGHPRRDGDLTEAVVHDARRWQSRDRLRGPIGSPPGIAWPAGIFDGETRTLPESPGQKNDEGSESFLT